MISPPKELSKNEQKKLAKKAEKAAKKAGETPDNNAKETTGVVAVVPIKAPPFEAATVATNTPKTSAGATLALATATVPKPDTLQLAYPTDASHPVMMKVLWASLQYQVPLEKAYTLPNNNFFLAQKQPALVLGENVIGGSGNAMMLAIASRSSCNTTNTSLLEEEWLELERTQLRAGSQVAFAKLAAALENSGGAHVLGGKRDTLADIALVTTLSFLAAEKTTQLPAIVQTYVTLHQPQLDAAKQAVVDFVARTSSSPTMDLSEPRIMTVLRSIFVAALDEMGIDTATTLPKTILTKCQTNTSSSKQQAPADYQCSAAMSVYATNKDKYTSAHNVAAAMMQAIFGADDKKEHPVIADLTVHGPGFILVRLRTSYLQTHANAFVKSGRLPFPTVAPQVCVVDFSSPNIAKEMHVGHLRSSILGESVCRILEAVGHTVHRVNHVGDWGTQFGMLIQYLKEESEATNTTDNNDSNVASTNITDLTAFYKSAKQRFDENAEFKKTSQTNVVKLQSGDAECVRIWNMLCNISRAAFEQVYKRLDVSIQECGESFYNPLIPAVIDEFAAAAKLTETDQGGAKVVFLDKFKIPLMLQKSDGGYGYDSTDMAALKYRLQTLKADRIIILTDFSQGDHFQMVFAAGRDIGWVDRNQRLEHIGFGTVNGEDGKRFKTRSGDTVRLVDLLDEAVQRMDVSLRARIADGKANITLEELPEVAEAIGYGAVKYYDLRRNPTSNYKFSYDQLLDTKGDTAVYLLYARVRLESIVAKAKREHNVNVETLLNDGAEIVLGHESERNLASALLTFADVYERTLEDLYPCEICEYVYKLAIAASEFVTQCKVLGSEEMSSRVLLCHATTLAMHQCFDLLGIRHVKRI